MSSSLDCSVISVAGELLGTDCSNVPFSLPLHVVKKREDKWNKLFNKYENISATSSTKIKNIGVPVKDCARHSEDDSSEDVFEEFSVRDGLGLMSCNAVDNPIVNIGLFDNNAPEVKTPELRVEDSASANKTSQAETVKVPQYITKRETIEKSDFCASASITKQSSSPLSSGSETDKVIFSEYGKTEKTSLKKLINTRIERGTEIADTVIELPHDMIKETSLVNPDAVVSSDCLTEIGGYGTVKDAADILQKETLQQKFIAGNENKLNRRKALRVINRRLIFNKYSHKGVQNADLGGKDEINGIVSEKGDVKNINITPVVKEDINSKEINPKRTKIVKSRDSEHNLNNETYKSGENVDLRGMHKVNSEVNSTVVTENKNMSPILKADVEDTARYVIMSTPEAHVNIQRKRKRKFKISL